MPCEILAAAGACGYVDNAPASLRSAPGLATSPQAQQQLQKSSINEEKLLHGFIVPLTRVGGLVTGGNLS
jgi:hypothetical protein